MVDIASRGAQGGRVLIVGATNVARSVFAERLLVEGLKGTGIEVSSCGTEAVDGSAMNVEMARQLSDKPENGQGLGARPLAPTLVRDADLVLCMTRAQRRAVVRAAPQGLRYTFALVDFSDVATKLWDATPDPEVEAGVDESVVGHVAHAAVLHRDEVHARLGDEADVADPDGGGDSAYGRSAHQLRDLVVPIVAALKQAIGSAP